MDWLDPAWRADAERWIRARLDERGIALAGELEQPHVEWWSRVLRVPTSAGDLWFKATAAADGFETRLTMLLAEVAPDRVPELVAGEPARAWTLMRDGGTRLRELVATRDDLHRWEELLPRYGELQLGARASTGATAASRTRSTRPS